MWMMMMMMMMMKNGETLEENAIVFLFSLIFLRFHLLRDMRFHHECDHLPEG